jgi:aspartate-semialdehyde dehydrogenase
MKKTPVAILGATGMVGQRMIEILTDHPYFSIGYIGASSRSAGKKYIDACSWRLQGLCPRNVEKMIVGSCSVEEVPKNISLVFSALDSKVAGDIEKKFADNHFFVVSNAGNHRMDPGVPLIIPEINPEQLTLLGKNPKGGIITNPNCCAIPLALSLAPLEEKWGIKSVVVSTWQAVSGAGYPGESAWDMIGTVHPHAGNEEEKLAIEPCKILSKQFPISARCVRVPVADGHLLSVQVTLLANPTIEEVTQAMKSWKGNAPSLYSSPTPILEIHTLRDRPSPRFDVMAGKGMTVSIGRIEECSVMGYKYFALAHNTIRGAAGAAIANGELLLQKGWIHS